MSKSDTRNYKDTLRLPQTDFPMKAGLPMREPQWLEKWQKMRLYQRLREQGEARETFILHDGPPYANGDIHLGHAMQKIIKDMIIRSQQMMGKNAPFVPGWDCHGLPIEWKIEEQYRAQGKRKEDVPASEFRHACRQFAQKWVDIQSAQFQRLGVLGDWDNPYLTMSYEAEAVIVEEFQKFIMDGSLYRGSKPVMWSIVEKTALAEAEVEYEEHVSPTIFVKFPIKDETDLFAMIWTTTPWTIPGNRAIAYAENLPYGIYQTPHGRVILCDDLAERVLAAGEIDEVTRLGDIDPAGLVARHPLHGQGYEFDVPILAGDFVTDETGTGLVHIAPGHGQDDFELGIKHNIDVPFMIDEAGIYYEHVPLFAGRCVLTEKGKNGDANSAVIDALTEAKALFAQGKLRHQYPHSWRSKAPLIFRNTPQWFVSMQHNDLRQKALAAIDEVEWLPTTGRNRIYAMIEQRPDWVLSRQRAWGVPLTIFVHKQSGEILRDAAVNERIAARVRQGGADAWFDDNPQDFLGSDYALSDYEQVQDILDVWFDSGSSHAYVLEARDELYSPAELYMEGSDQHRGWFQSSLLEACATRGHAPYKQVLTHGFVVDQKGKKMSKSSGKALTPEKIVQQSGAEIIRLWVASSDFTEDLRIGDEIIKNATDAYRKMRNTLRFILGNINDYEPSETIPIEDMPELERYILHRLAVLEPQIRAHYTTYEFRRVFQLLFNFMTVDLSAFYFDIRKDALYCDAPTSLNRRACQQVLDQLFHCLTAWLAPILCFTMEEVWQSRFADEDDSVHLRLFSDLPADWQDDGLAEKWEQLRLIRRVVTGALEIERTQKRIGSSLEAAPQVYIEDAALFALTEDSEMADLCITSQIEIIHGAAPKSAFGLEDVAGIGVVPQLAQGKKCQRSWKILADIGADPDYPDLSPRDAAAVRAFDAQ